MIHARSIFDASPSPRPPKPEAPKPWTVLDPADTDFRPGCAFDQIDFLATLSLGYWPEGMSFRHKGLVWTVVGPNRLAGPDGTVFAADVHANRLAKRIRDVCAETA